MVYYRVPATVAATPAPSRPTVAGGLQADPLYGKVQISTDSPFYDWVERELWRWADHHCATTTEQFRQCDKAVTRAGQVRSGNRHEKNDDRPVDDRRGYVLGWSPEAKIDALLAQAKQVQRQLASLAAERARVQVDVDAATTRRDLLAKLVEVDTWDDVDWRTVATRIARLQHDRCELERSSRDLRT